MNLTSLTVQAIITGGTKFTFSLTTTPYFPSTIHKLNNSLIHLSIHYFMHSSNACTHSCTLHRPDAVVVVIGVGSVEATRGGNEGIGTAHQVCVARLFLEESTVVMEG